MPRSAILAIRIAVSAVAALALWHCCVQPFRASDLELAIRQRSERADISDRTRAVILARENLRQLDGIAPFRRLAVTWYILYAGNCELLERWDEAVAVYTRALAVDQRPELYFNRGLDRIHAGQMEAGVADIITAARFQPFVLDQLDGELRNRVAAAAGLK